jgi:hypothetical protein
VTPNHLAQTLQRLGARGTEEDLEALIYCVANDALERAALRITRDWSWCTEAGLDQAEDCAKAIRELKHELR